MTEWISDDGRMLFLASASYRGVFCGGNWRAGHAEKIREAIQGCLQSAPSDIGRWEIVWGPAVHRTPHGEFDDGVVYVAKSNGRYAVVVRGTNPVSLADWLFGDLLIQQQVSWPFGAGTQISLSTALGLVSLLTAGSELPSFGPLAKLIDGVSAGLQDSGIDLRTFLGSSASDVAGNVSNDLIGFLCDVLSNASANEFPLEIMVTGHSKGAALAAVLAQWLVETAGNDRAEHKGWTATQLHLRCFTYAGPTPGNDIFATRLRSSFGNDFRRIWNVRDLVPHAFDTLDHIANYYTDAILIKPAIEGVLSLIRGKYSQIGPGLPFSGPDDFEHRLILSAPFQHLDAYLNEFKIPHDALWFMGFMGLINAPIATGKLARNTAP